MPATIVSPTPKPVYPITGKNFAPRRPLEEIGKNGETWSKNTLCEAILEKYEQYKARDYSAWRDVVDIGRMVANLRTGKLLLLRNAIDNRYLFVQKDGKYSDNKTVGGLFQFYSTKLTAEWLSSQPAIDPVCPSDDDQIEEYIDAVRIVQDYYHKKFFNNDYETLESLSAQDYGTYITRFRFDPEKQDIVCELLPFPACRWDIRFTPEESQYFMYESKCPTSVLKHLLKADINEDDGFPDQYGLQIIEQIARQGGNVQGAGKERPWGEYDVVGDETTVTELWLQPSAYCDIDLESNEPTIGGIDLPKGHTLMELFPTGMCIVGINNMKTIIGIYAEDHREHIVTGYYHKQSFSGIGKGVSDAVDVKKEMDDMHSQVMAYIKSHGTPAYYYNQDLITESQARKIGKPRAVIPVDFKNAPEGVNNINQAIQAVTPSNPAASVFQYQQTLENFLQMSFQVTTFSDGMPGVNNTTATGAQIGESNERMMLVPQHRNKAGHRMRSAKVIFNLFKKHKDKPQFFATRSKSGITKGKYLSGSQFDGVDIEFEIVADSEIPQTRFTKEMNLSKLLNFSGGIAGIIQAAQIDPEITSAIVSQFGADLPIAKPNDIARVCRQRVEQARKMLEQEMQLQQMMMAVTGEAPDNADLPVAIVDQLVPPIIPAEPHYMQKVAWLSELLDTDELMYANPMLRWVVAEMISRHTQEKTLGDAITMQDQNLGLLMANLPSLLGEQAMSMKTQQMVAAAEAEAQAAEAEAQSEAAERQAQAQAQGQMELKAMESEINAAQSQADYDRELEKGEIEHDRQLEIEEMKLQAQKEKEQKRAYPKGVKR